MHWPTVGQMPGRRLDTYVPSAGNAVHHTAFAMRRGRFHQERLKMALGYVRVCYRELRGASKRAKKQAVPPAMTWGNINSQLQKHLSPWFLVFSPWLLGLSEEHTSAQDHSHPRSLCVGANCPLYFLVTVQGIASFHCVSLQSQKLERLSPLIFSWCV